MSEQQEKSYSRIFVQLVCTTFCCAVGLLFAAGTIHAVFEGAYAYAIVPALFGGLAFATVLLLTRAP